jgi:hypothetical protein
LRFENSKPQRAPGTQRMIIKMADEMGQNNNPYEDTLLSYEIESMERKYNEQFQQDFKVLKYMIAEEPKPNRPFGFHGKTKKNESETK